MGDKKVVSPLSGEVVELSKVKDEAFASGMLGKGIAIIPDTGIVVSPINGRVDMVPESKHAVAVVSDDGVELLIHVGLETVSLKGKPFTIKVKEGEKIKIGDVLMEADIKAIKEAGLDIVTPIIVSNTDSFKEITCTTAKTVAQGDDLISLK